MNVRHNLRTIETVVVAVFVFKLTKNACCYLFSNSTVTLEKVKL